MLEKLRTNSFSYGLGNETSGSKETYVYSSCYKGMYYLQ